MLEPQRHVDVYPILQLLNSVHSRVHISFDAFEVLISHLRILTLLLEGPFFIGNSDVLVDDRINVLHKLPAEDLSLSAFPLTLSDLRRSLIAYPGHLIHLDIQPSQFKHCIILVLLDVPPQLQSVLLDVVLQLIHGGLVVVKYYLIVFNL